MSKDSELEFMIAMMHTTPEGPEKDQMAREFRQQLGTESRHRTGDSPLGPMAWGFAIAMLVGIVVATGILLVVALG